LFFELTATKAIACSIVRKTGEVYVWVLLWYPQINYSRLFSSIRWLKKIHTTVQNRKGMLHTSGNFAPQKNKVKMGLA
jgi:hypothetical protein